MSDDRERSPAEDESDAPSENPFGWFPLVVLLVLVVGGLWLVLRLRQDSQVQDCVWSGRRNCAPIETDRP